MTVSNLAIELCPSVVSNCEEASNDSSDGSDDGSIDAVLNAARAHMPDIAWAAYAAGELKCLLGQGDDGVVWPGHIALEDFDA
ncbi:hypothetical protein OA77_25245, partial [Pseudomonas coronafaciens]